MTDDEYVEAFDSYCRKVILNKFLDIKRREKRRAKHEVLLCDLDDNVLINRHVDGYDTYPSDALYLVAGGKVYEIYNEVLLRALLRLSEIDRLIILLRWWDGYKDAEIGERIGLSADSTRVKRRRAFDKLNDLVSQEETLK